MISVEEALEQVLRVIQPLDSVQVSLEEALGLVLAEEVRAGFDIPPWDNSAMDGYALRAQDIVGASPERPVTLPVIDEVAAGRMPERELAPRTAMRIMTGAPIPPGADTIVRFEDTDELERRDKRQDLSSIAILTEAPLGKEVRRAGEDVQAGTAVMEAGDVLSPGALGVLASLGRVGVRAIRRPVVGILATGDEVVSPGGELAPGQIYDSNSYSIAALVRQTGAVPRLLGVVGDRVEELETKVRTMREFDLVLTSAGVSVGYYDVVKEVLAAHGELNLWTVRMRPGKPVAFGLLHGPKGSPWPRPVPLLGLPGNPVSAMVVFHILARPALWKMFGHGPWAPPTVEAVLDDPILNHDSRRTYARAFVERRNGVYHARLSGPQGSNILTAMARANGLAICPEDVSELKAGERVQVLLLD